MQRSLKSFSTMEKAKAVNESFGIGDIDESEESDDDDDGGFALENDFEGDDAVEQALDAMLEMGADDFEDDYCD